MMHAPDLGYFDGARATILRLQNADGSIPWFKGGVIDPWNHLEATMGLHILGERTAAEKAIAYLQNSQPKDKLFLFSAGPLSNILIHQLFKKYPNNTYIDIGSCMDNQHGLKVSDRAYLRWDSWKHLARCYWNHKTNPDSISCDTHGKSKLQRQLIRLKALYQRLKQHLPFAISQRKITALKPNTAHKNSNQKQIMLVLALYKSQGSTSCWKKRSIKT